MRSLLLRFHFRQLALLLVPSAFAVLFSCSDNNYVSPSPSFRPPTTRDAGNGCVSTSAMCSGSCTDTKRDPNNCGGCGYACTVGMKCESGKCSRASGFAIRKIFYGDTDRNGVTSKDAWKAYGRDVDGVTSTGQGTDTVVACKPPTGAPSILLEDGEGGIDNSFGRNILPLIAPFVATPSPSATAALEQGARTNMFELYNWQGELDDADMGTRFLRSEKLSSARWDGTDIRDSVPLPSLPSTGQAYSSRIEGGIYGSTNKFFTSLTVDLLIGNETMTLSLEGPAVTMKIAADTQSASEGMLSGYIEVTELQAAIATLIGRSNKELCTGATIDAIKEAIRQAADVPSNGAPDPLTECDAISIGVGFEAGLVVIGKKRATDLPTSDPCVQ